jgi:Domain of unknown function (DUF4132)
MAPRTKKSNLATELRIEKALYLQPADWAKVHWREHVPLEKPAAMPFDLEKAQAHLRQLAGNVPYIWTWIDANIGIVMTRAEAHFWLTAMIEMSNRSTGKKFLQQFDSLKFTGDVSVTDLYIQLSKNNPDKARYGIIANQLKPEICLPLVNLLSREEFMSLLLAKYQPPADISIKDDWRIEMTSGRLQESLAEGFKKYILPYQSHSEIQLLKQEIEQALEIQSWPQDRSEKPSFLFYLAAALGVGASLCVSTYRRLKELVESWPDTFYHDHYRTEHHSPLSIVMGLESAEQIVFHARRLQLPIEDVRSWLAHTEFSAIDYVGDTILRTTDKTKREGLLKEFLECLQAPEIAPIMLKLTLARESGQIARKWLQDNPGNAIAGLIPIAAGEGPLAEAAIDFLRSMQRRGHQGFIEQCLQQESMEVTAVIRSKVLADRSQQHVVFDDRSTPDWLQKALELVKPLKKRGWAIDPSELPAITCENQRFSDNQISLVLDALEQSTLDAPHPFIGALKAHIDPLVLDGFAWKLLETWLAGGGPAKGKWALIAIGLIGCDPSAIKLSPLLQLWPRYSKHARVTLGLDCLKAIGTITALTQIDDIARNYKYSRLKSRAQECMEEIAKSRGITLEQLADRIVPNYDLDDRGQYIFDFGPRRFQLLIDGNLNPIVQDAQGKQMNNLPRRNKKDNSEQADRAIADWKVMKKQIGDALKVHSLRLEAAMVQCRTWQWREFESLLIQHPLMTHLAQRLVWATYDGRKASAMPNRGSLQTTFRVTEDWTCTDRDEHHYSPDSNATIGIVHPLWLDDATKFMWIEVLGENHIIQPFVQLSREVYALTAEEETQKEIKRFKDIPTPGNFLIKMMKNLGWFRGRMGDQGGYHFHHKYFKGAEITAMIGEYENLYSGQYPEENVNMTGCLFMRGQFPNLVEYPMSRSNPSLQEHILKLGEVDRTIVSEVLRDMSAIASGRL